VSRTQRLKQRFFRVELTLCTPRTNGTMRIESGHGVESEGQLWTLEELPELLNRTFARDEYVELIPDLDRFVLEIVASADVLSYGFERWQKKKSMTYGAFCPVVVRLRDRLAIPDAADQKLADQCWKRRWSLFRNQAAAEYCSKLTWRARDDLRVGDLLNAKELACLGLTSPLPSDERDTFEVLRDTGIPIAIWLREKDADSPCPANWHKSMLKLIKKRRLAELRQAVQEVRRSRDTEADETHFGNSLTLMWDDPDRPALKYSEEGVLV
jgi:hypothetical protein